MAQMEQTNRAIDRVSDKVRVCDARRDASFLERYSLTEEALDRLGSQIGAESHFIAVAIKVSNRIEDVMVDAYKMNLKTGVPVVIGHSSDHLITLVQRLVP